MTAVFLFQWNEQLKLPLQPCENRARLIRASIVYHDNPAEAALIVRRDDRIPVPYCLFDILSLVVSWYNDIE